MRIIAGTYASRRLETLKGQATRPTLDKVKEAVFSALGGMFDGGTMLDLYAGSGAIGLEAVSRGMNQAVLVDQSHAAAEIIRKNIALLGCQKQTRLLAMNDRKALSLLAKEGVQFDLVYLDPPYEKQHNEEVMTYLVEHGMLKNGARVVIEAKKEESYTQAFGPLQYQKEKVYGIMKITYYRFEQSHPEERSEQAGQE
ncbi:MAG: 16S rRNA (guanine(966)-N(2))-methyltransferase RsmD [Erysipelotrichaceae bacterium]|jgi:16S rRNA (guanine966-N2)-methyltransferase|nr:16S rRNA (guanine(966)-N(2))-methyltransferase RsmD [Erysipelotrichaceae bacterium]MCI1325680.1 16S rRNA (guanine(966)-N(2))-methyltransferase RsmD [Solobacterium sp.]MCH4044843.1 16S rRNA (guanine(966)-N(2))-methyltransferase RsmD [Erysipelotrichaceae bacterium]MCH4122055.1 16S rRNA (guanine(966)-N(2))-methyltransferase RsmD [Erysipelotrichaceae bacterium]MCI1363460.1 16S rRNA (guanine(966)-N(2))-methyltransferase RsmD [Solobacterium sp.]